MEKEPSPFGSVCDVAGESGAGGVLVGYISVLDLASVWDSHQSGSRVLKHGVRQAAATF